MPVKCYSPELEESVMFGLERREKKSTPKDPTAALMQAVYQSLEELPVRIAENHREWEREKEVDQLEEKARLFKREIQARRNLVVLRSQLRRTPMP